MLKEMKSVWTKTLRNSKYKANGEPEKTIALSDEDKITLAYSYSLALTILGIGAGLLIRKGYDRIFWEKRCRKAFSEIDRRYPGASLFLIKGRPGPLPYGLRLTYGPNKAGKEWLMGEWGTKNLDRFKTVITEMAKQVEDMN